MPRASVRLATAYHRFLNPLVQELFRVTGQEWVQKHLELLNPHFHPTEYSSVEIIHLQQTKRNEGDPDDSLILPSALIIIPYLTKVQKFNYLLGMTRSAPLCNNNYVGAAVVAQLVEQLLLTPEVHSSNPVIGKIYIEQ